MASRFRRNQEGKQATKKGSTGSAKPTRQLVPKFRLWAKGALAPYPSEEGNPLYSGDLEPEEFLGEKRIAESRNDTNCEWLHRPGMAVSFASAAIRTGLREVRSPDKNLSAVAAWLKSNPKFADAIKILDTGKSKTPDKKHIRSSVSSFVDLLCGLPAQDREALARLALRSAKLYLLAMNLLEAMDLIRRPKLFAKKMAKAGGGEAAAEDVASWLKHPEDSKKLKEMLAKAVIKKVHRHQQSAQAAKKPRSSSGAFASPSKSSAGSGKVPSTAARSSSSIRHKKKKARRSSSSPQNKRSASASLSGGKPDRRAREKGKEKKEKQDEKKAKRHLSPSASSQEVSRKDDKKRKGSEERSKKKAKRSRSPSARRSRSPSGKPSPKRASKLREDRRRQYDCDSYTDYVGIYITHVYQTM